MTTADQMRSTLERYLQCVADHDVAAVLDLFAEEISVEDPVGGAPGREDQRGGRAWVEAPKEFAWEAFRQGPDKVATWRAIGLQPPA